MTKEHLMNLDKEFCESVSVEGARAWANHFMDEGIMLTKLGDNIITESAIYNAMRPFFEGIGNSLIWSPEDGAVSDDGSLGYTFGKYSRTSINHEGDKVTETGRYMTIWRRLGDGKYKVEVDMGN